jgi:hypothetical protein
MKIFIEHDDHGTIHAVGAAAEGSARTTLIAGPGRHVSQVDAPDVTHEKDFDNLRKIKQGFRVEGHPNQARLVPK